jgi:hypothetical protein
LQFLPDLLASGSATRLPPPSNRVHGKIPFFSAAAIKENLRHDRRRRIYSENLSNQRTHPPPTAHTRRLRLRIQNSGRPSVFYIKRHFLGSLFSVIKTKVDNRWRRRASPCAPRLFFVIDCFVCIVHSFDCFSLLLKGKFISVTRF